MIHRLTGGRWGEVAAPIVEPATAAVPLLILLAIPLFIAIPVLYPWFGQRRDQAGRRLLLSERAVVHRARPAGARRLVGTGAVVAARERPNSERCLAAQGLVFHALIISSVSIDWYLSLEAPFTSSSFGASVAISALVGALGLDRAGGADAGKRSGNWRYRRALSREHSRHHLHRFHGGAGDLVRRPAARRNLVRRT